MTYNNFCCHSTKARISLIQKVFNLEVTGKRDKVYVKTLMKFQKDKGLTPNAIICEKTYNELVKYSKLVLGEDSVL